MSKTLWFKLRTCPQRDPKLNMLSVISRRHNTPFSLSTFYRYLSLSSSSLHNKYSFNPPLSLSQNTKHINNPSKKNQKPRYRPPSSLNRTGKKPIQSDLPFDFRFSYTESSPNVRPIGLREPKYSPFGPGVVDRGWTGVCAPAEDLKVESVERVREDLGMEERRRVMREKVLGEGLTSAERRVVVERCLRHRTKRQVNLGRDGLTHNMLNDIHNHWKHAEGVRIKCMGVPTVDMKNVCDQLEDKTFGKIIHRHGGLLVLYRGRFYHPNKRPVIPLMLWKPREPIYPRLIKTTIDGFSIEETKEMRKKGLSVPALTKLAKNGYYGSLVPMVRDAFLADEFVRIDCRGLEKSDYSKIGCKLRDLVPCVLVTFDKEQVVVWRGRNYKPIEDGYWLADRDPFDNPDNDLSSGSEEQDSTDDGNVIHNFHSGDELSDLEV